MEAQRRRAGNSAGLVPDQIAAVVRLWPGLDESQRKDLLRASSSAGLTFRLTQDPPHLSSGLARVSEVEAAMRRRLDGAEAASVVALIRARAFGRERVTWALSNQPVDISVRLAAGNWLLAEVRGDLLPRLFGLPTGFWVGVVGLLLSGGVLLAILREGRAVERIANSVEAFAVTGVPHPI